jgi:deoxyribodipyrimidine photo-lyase
MQRAQRVEANPALEHAVALANEGGSTVVAYFGLTDAYPGANLRHYRFMLEGLAETAEALRARGVGMVLRAGHPPAGAAALAAETDAAAVVTDMGVLPMHREWRRQAAEQLSVPLFEVDADSVVPVRLASDREEYAARTIRPRIRRQLQSFLGAPGRNRLGQDSLDHRLPGLDPGDTDGLIDSLDIDLSVPPSPTIAGGRSRGLELLDDFIRNRIEDYHETARDPAADATSHLSPYLHFGQLSPLEVALRASATEGPGPEAFLEQLVVRRALARNLTFHNGSFRRIGCLPEWAQRTLAEHSSDPREHIYDQSELEAASTGDPYWNAAQTEMTVTGRMHGYMRMYWGKRILEWSPSPQQALDSIIALNDRWELDGRDPNGYAGALWCLGKHDRAWKERPVVGKVRWMSPRGLERKFDIDAYVRRTKELGRSHPKDHGGTT